MTLLDRLLKRLTAEKQRSNGPKPTGQAPIAASNGFGNWLNKYKETRDTTILKNYRPIYRKGGVVRTALDSYVHYMLSPGYATQSDDENAAKQEEIMELLFGKTSEFDEVIRKTATDAICIGDGVALILTGSGGKENIPVALQHLPIERMRFVQDVTGEIEKYELLDTVGGMRVLGSYPPEQILHICLFPDGDGAYGAGLMESALDEIKHDTTTGESTAAAIRRHGYGIWHARVSSTDPDKPVSVADINTVASQLKEIGAKSEIVTAGNVEIIGLNTTGQTNVTSYNDWSLLRLCTALAIPGELLGVRQGTTDATAVERIQNFYKRIKTLQDALAIAINTQFLDKTLLALGYSAGDVWIKYNDPSPEDSLKRAQYIATLSTATPGDPFALMSRRQQQVYLGIDPDEWAKDEEYDANGEL